MKNSILMFITLFFSVSYAYSADIYDVPSCDSKKFDTVNDVSVTIKSLKHLGGGNLEDEFIRLGRLLDCDCDLFYQSIIKKGIDRRYYIDIILSNSACVNCLFNV